MGPQKKWLNEMAEKGYRLVRTGKLEYEFEECAPGQYVYEIEYVGDKSFEHEQDYKEFLESLGYKVFYKNINLDYSAGKAVWRPSAEKDGQVSTTASTYNKELLIIEKENDGKPFDLHSTPADKISYFKRLRNPWLIMSAILLVLAAFFLFPLLWIFGALCLIPTLRAQVEIHKIKKEAAGTDSGGNVKESALIKAVVIISLLLIAGGLTFRIASGDKITLKVQNYKSGSFLGFSESQLRGLCTAKFTSANGKISRTISPKNDSKTLKASIETKSGSMKVTIKTADGTVLYESAEGSVNETFTLTTSGEKLIVLFTLDHARGSYDFEYR